jgi:hypothetical protein
MDNPSVISSFQGKYEFLSNFYRTNVEIDGIIYKNAEAAFQAMKVNDVSTKKKFSHLDAANAKKLGRKVNLPSDWDYMRSFHMKRVLNAKFKKNHVLGELLKSTSPAILEEGNTWGDTYWGVCKGKGENMLGKLLMAVRQELLDK